jgi:nucleotide-binding universal stress UspA family protein
MTLTTIIAGCDLSEPADHALDRACALALQHGAKLVVVHAQANDEMQADAGDSAMLKMLGEVSGAVKTEEAVRLADKLAGIQAKGVTTELISRVGPADELLTEIATEIKAELIVLGTTGHTGLSRLLLGSVAASTIRRATCDVLVVRGPGTQPFTKPLIATDFDPQSSKAIRQAARICAPGATLEVVHAWQLPAGSWGATLLGQARFPWSSVRDAVVASAQSQVTKLVAEHAAEGRTLHVELIQGAPSQVITERAETAGHDLIAVGAHGHRGVRRLLLGSVAENVIRHAPCSVLVVHADPPPVP